MSKKSQAPRFVVQNAFIDIWDNDIVVRGVLAPAYIKGLTVDEYQREQRNPGQLASMIKAVIEGVRFPEVELSHRTEEYLDAGNGEYHFFDAMFIVDGQQRAAATMFACQDNLGLKTRFSVVVRVGKDIVWEKKRFEALNLGKNREAVSKNVLLRNRKEEHPVVGHIFGISQTDRTSALYGRVTWAQHALRNEVMNAWTLARLVCVLHEHRVPRLGSEFESVLENLDQIGREFGVMAARGNVKAFFAAIDAAWNIRDVTYKAGAFHLRSLSLTMMASVVSNHHDFWTEDKSICIGPEMIRRMQRFKFHEPHVANVLTKESGRADELADRFIAALNHAKRNKLRPRVQLRKSDPGDDIADAAE